MDIKVNLDLTNVALIVGIVFLILKMCGVITWPWLIVCIPLIIYGISLLISLIIFLVVFLNAR